MDSNSSRRWTYEERCLLKLHYNVMNIDELASLLDRGVPAIRNQVSYLKKRGWTFNRKKDENSKERVGRS